MVSQKKFDELVEATTGYLQKLMDRVKELEEKVEALESKKPASRQSKAEAK